MSETLVPGADPTDDGWELLEEDTERLGSNRLVTVDSTRYLYGDRELRDRVREATGVDHQWRTFFTSELVTSPPMSPGIADLVVRTIALPQANRRFSSDLEDRGFRNVRKREEGRLGLDSGDRARTTRFSASIPVEGAPDVGVDAWLVIWVEGAEMRVAGGIYPVEELAADGGDGLFAPPEQYRRELFEMVRSVE